MSMWTDSKVADLCRLYPDQRAADVAQALGMTVVQIYRKATQLGLRKSEAFFTDSASGRFDGERGMSSRFQPGQRTWNKGLKGWKAGGRSAETRFKPGSKPHQTMPIGSLRFTKDGLLQRKIGEEPGANHKRWRSVHELVWIEANGPVPAGHIVVFKPGMRTAILEQVTPDRVECISRAENARRNHPKNRDPELARLVQLKGAITRQVNRIAREAKEQQP